MRLGQPFVNDYPEICFINSAVSTLKNTSQWHKDYKTQVQNKKEVIFQIRYISVVDLHPTSFKN